MSQLTCWSGQSGLVRSVGYYCFWFGEVGPCGIAGVRGWFRGPGVGSSNIENAFRVTRASGPGPPKFQCIFCVFFCFCFGTGPVRTVHMFVVRNILFFKNRDPGTRNRPGRGGGPPKSRNHLFLAKTGRGQMGRRRTGRTPPKITRTAETLPKPPEITKSI